MCIRDREGPEEGTSDVVRGEAQPGGAARYRDAQSLGLGEDGFVDLASGALIAVDKDDHTFDGLGEQDDHDAAANGSGGSGEDSARETSKSEEGASAAAAS